MYVEKKDFIKWIINELGAKPSYKKDEYICNCPFCDKNENHYDFTINTEKMVMNCWRGFDRRCESGHNVLTLLSFYYDVSFERAKELVKEKFETENSLLRLKKKLKNLDNRRILQIDTQKILWDMPRGVESIEEPVTDGGKKAKKWLLKTRKIPLELITAIKPYYFGKNVDKRWRKYNDRVFFPVVSKSNKAWIAYSMDKKSTKKRPKTMNPPGSILSNMLFMYDFCFDSKIIVVCEGIFDALRMFMFGYAAVAIFGVNISGSQLDLLNDLDADELVVCLDPDANKVVVDSKGRKSSKSFKLAREVEQFFLGDVSIMKLKREDPDRSSFKEIRICYGNRERLGRSTRRLKALRTMRT